MAIHDGARDAATVRAATGIGGLDAATLGGAGKTILALQSMFMPSRRSASRASSPFRAD